jgi:hypothetical protein
MAVSQILSNLLSWPEGVAIPASEYSELTIRFLLKNPSRETLSNRDHVEIFEQTVSIP